jgi:hypothetical protein
MQHLEGSVLSESMQYPPGFPERRHASLQSELPWRHPTQFLHVFVAVSQAYGMQFCSPPSVQKPLPLQASFLYSVLPLQ